ncbi:flagellar basal-body MS-ring/collar protein FliF [Candidatus Latescibacterota bacterium]
MFETFERLMARLRAVWDSMTLNQKVISSGVFVALIITLAYLSTLKDSFQQYGILFTELDAKSASEIITHLEQQNIPFKLSADGSTISVPRNQATQLKIDLTAEGLPESGIVGYEILDTTTFGISERIQDVNIKRALEGVISNALVTIDAIQNANVILSIPEPTLFTDSEKPTTAAVILKLSRSSGLSQQKIQGLTFLIASSVPGLDPRNVTIVDTEGNTLTKPYMDEGVMISSTQLDHKMQYDNYLANNIIKLLNAFGNSVVTVNTVLDWDKIQRTTTAYDDESSALVSEERTTDSSPSPDGLGEFEESVMNYETGEIIEHFEKNPGEISQISVSVYVDYRDSTFIDADEVEQTVKVPWPDTQIATIRTQVEGFIGYNQVRGDRIEVEQIEFDDSEIAVAEGGFTARATIVEGIRALFMGLALIGSLAILFFLLRSMASTLDPSKISIKAEKEFEKRKLEEEEKPSESERDVLVKRIVKTSIENPEIAAKTLKTFFKEE